MGTLPELERRDPGIILVLSVVTCGLYLIFWYYWLYQDLEKVGGRTPTGNSYVVDLLLTIVTCSLYGVWVDYRISDQLNELQREHGVPGPDSTTLAVGLDVAAFVTGGLCNVLTSAIQQDQLNKLVRAVNERGGGRTTWPGGPG